MRHIINLVVKEFLYGPDFQKYLEVEDGEEETMGFWQKRGAYGQYDSKGKKYYSICLLDTTTKGSIYPLMPTLTTR